MKKHLYLLLLLTSVLASAQTKGNALNFSDLGNATIYGNQIRNFEQQNLIPSPVITLDVKALSNVLAESYTAVFNVIQIGKTTVETNNLMKERIVKVKN
tara:strand:+ start:10425 stop:10721 length:297 start_codon:yes stop_codon:yes gene_type:complete